MLKQFRFRSFGWVWRLGFEHIYIYICVYACVYGRRSKSGKDNRWCAVDTWFRMSGDGVRARRVEDVVAYVG